MQSRRALGSSAKSKVAIWVRFEVKVEGCKVEGLWVRQRSQMAKWALGCDLGSGFDPSLGSPAKSNDEVGSGLRSGLWV